MVRLIKCIALIVAKFDLFTFQSRTQGNALNARALVYNVSLPNSPIWGLRPSPRLTSSRIIVSNRLHLHYAGRPSLQNPQRPDVPVWGARWRREQTLTPVAHRIRVPVRTKDGRYLEIEAQHCPSECVRVAGSHAPISF